MTDLKNLLVILALLCFSQTVFSDIPGSKDPANIKRYENSQIVRYEEIKFDRYQLPLGKMTKFDFGTKAAEFEQSENLEGEIIRTTYRITDTSRSSLEIFRNYESFFKAEGWTIRFAASGKAEFGNSFTHIYEKLKGHDQLLTYNDAQGHFLVAQNPTGNLTAALFVTKFENGLSGNTEVQKNEPLVQLDVIKTNAMEEKMVLLTASEMSQSIQQQGSVALYGIYFDFNSSNLKPESNQSLTEIATLLKSEPSRKLIIVGHTDNVGDFKFNLDLSQRRAEAVVKELVTTHQIAAERLTAFGASFAAPAASNASEEGRSKNRRVELVSAN